MFIVKRNNIERVALNEATRDAYISKGFVLVKESSKEDIKKDSGNSKKVNGIKALEDMTVEELKDYASKKRIDIGKASTENGILEKIKAVEVK